MRSFRHDYTTVEQYLHHRSPYLMVDRIIEIGDQAIVTEKVIRGDEPFLAGHFPGSPIFPGAMMQEVTTQSAGILIAARHNPMESFDTSDPFFNEYALGVLVRVSDARYKSFARPGDVLTTKVELVERVETLFEFRSTLRIGERTIMRNSFQLTNIPSRVLQGPTPA